MLVLGRLRSDGGGGAFWCPGREAPLQTPQLSGVFTVAFHFERQLLKLLSFYSRFQLINLNISLAHPEGSSNSFGVFGI